MRRLAPTCAAALLCGCALPVVSAGTFLPAGDLQKGQVHASISMEMGRVLAGPSDVNQTKQGPQTQQWEVSTWFASDASVRYGLANSVALEVQLKLTNPVSPFVPELVGGAAGARVRILDRKGDSGLAIELGARGVFVAVDQDLRRTKGPASAPDVQLDRWSYRAIGFEAPLIATWRFNKLFAMTGSPFLRAYWIRATHSVQSTQALTETDRLDWTPVLSSGLGISAALSLGPLDVAPGVAVELATRPGPGQATQLLFEPGLSVGMRF